MDITDYKIIEILQEEGRISMKDLGKIVGLTSPAKRFCSYFFT